jgi:hypothetical protein
VSVEHRARHWTLSGKPKLLACFDAEIEMLRHRCVCHVPESVGHASMVLERKCKHALIIVAVVGPEHGGTVSMYMKEVAVPSTLRIPHQPLPAACGTAVGEIFANPLQLLLGADL